MQKNHISDRVLVVDDVPENIEILTEILRDQYDVLSATSGEKALDIARGQIRPSMILLDVMMPGIDGHEVCRRLKSDSLTKDIPVMFVTARDEASEQALGFELGAVDYITKPLNPDLVLARVKNYMALYDRNIELAARVKERTLELTETRLKIIQRLGRAAEFRDNDTGFHVIRMSHYARLIAREYGGHPSWEEMLFNAAPMHDVGKIGVPDQILLKPGKLDRHEWTLMKKHCEFGAEILGEETDSLLAMARTIALTHHEKWNGSGYPQGLSGKGIPLEGRITAIADVFDALTTERPYKRAWSMEEALDLIQEQRGQHFDPDLVDLFLGVLPEVEAIKLKYSD